MLAKYVGLPSIERSSQLTFSFKLYILFDIEKTAYVVVVIVSLRLVGRGNNQIAIGKGNNQILVINGKNCVKPWMKIVINIVRAYSEFTKDGWHFS